MKFRADKTDIKRYVEEGWWEASKGLAEFVRENAQRNPSGIAYRTSESQISWNEYFHAAMGLAEQIKRETTKGGRILVWLPDCPDIHICYLACEMAGVVTVGVGWKAGLQELKYLSEVTGASILLSKQNNPLGKLDDISEYLNLNSLSLEDIFSNHIVDGEGPNLDGSIGPSDLWFLNSTSGTTGLPKCVMQTQNRWFYFHKKQLNLVNLLKRTFG